MRYRLVLLILMLALPGTVLAGKPTGEDKEMLRAQKALAVQDYAGAYAAYQRLQKRSPLSQFMIGLFLQQGWGRPADPVAACTWFEKAAQKHVPAAEHHWGDCLAQGIGRPVDIATALALYDRAASHGHLISWCSAADYYIRGQGVHKDIAKGMELCVRVAQAGSTPAMLKLAHTYREGVDMPQDLAKARSWYREAALRHDRVGQYHFGLMLAQGEGGDPDQHAALFWLESAAAQGYASAYLPTAVLYGNAQVQPQTGALAPEHLAKIYLWTEAAKARALSTEQQAAAAQIETQVLSVMPSAWREDLDRQVAAHLSKFPPETVSPRHGSLP